MWQFVALLVTMTVTVCLTSSVTIKPLWKDCGKSANRSLFLTEFNILPYPIELPGNVKVTAHMENKHLITSMRLHLVVERQIWRDYYLKIPCAHHYGSCDVMSVCNDLENPPRNMVEPVQQMKKLFLEAGHVLKCPVMPGKLEFDNVEHEMPEVPSFIAMVAAGKYKVRAELTDPTEGNREVGCFELIVETTEHVDPDDEEDVDEDCFFFC